MKKLIAMIGAVAMAFGLYAEGSTPASNYYSTSFEAADPGVTDKTWMPADGWTTEQTDAFTLGDQDDADELPYAKGRARRNTLFKGLATNNNFLKLETGTNTLSHGIVADQVYFDQLVKFTGYEEDPTIAADAKIAVWLSAIDADDQADPVEEGSTNLFVTVGTGTGTKKVQVAGDFKVDQWYRVTIKSIGDVSKVALTSQLGFQLFIDGAAASIVDADKDYNGNYESFNDKAAALYGKGQLFTAIKTKDLALATVAYQGIGGVDDIIFSEEAPDFDQFVEFTIGAVPGVDVVKVEGPEGVELRVPYSVLPGSQVKIYVKAKDGYRIDNLPEGYITKTISQAGEVSIADELAGKVVKGAVQVVNVATPTVTNIYAAAELGVGLTGLKTGDTATVLENCAIGDDFSFTKNTTITVSEANVWNVFIANENETTGGVLVDNVGLFAGKKVYVDFDNAIDDENVCMLQLAGTIAGEINATEKGIVDIAAAAELSGTINAVNVQVEDDVTFVDSGKIVSATDLNEFADNFLPADKVAITYDETTKLYTAQIEQAPQSGFMVIIAGQDPLYYETLQEAINNAMGVEDAKVFILEDCDIASTITVNDDLDLEIADGVTVTAAWEEAKARRSAAFLVRDDATLTLYGSDTSKLIGRVTVGYQVQTKPSLVFENANLVINGGQYEVDGAQTVVHVNGSCDNCSVTINDATLVSQADNGVQFNGKGTFAVNNSSITGATAIYMKGGELTIDENSVITATKAEWTAPKANRDGSDATGDAIVMDSNTSYHGDISLTVEDGAEVTATATGAAAIRETITAGDESTTVKIDAPQIASIALTPDFAAKVAAGDAELPGFVAVAGTTPYTTLAAAVAADGDVTLLTNVTLTETLAIAKAKAINLAGKTITFGDGLQKGITTEPNGVTGDLVISNGNFAVAGTRPAKGYAFVLYRVNALIKDVTMDLEGFEYGLEAETMLGKPAYWTDALQYAIVCENVDVSGNGSLFHFENVEATLDEDCSATLKGTPFGAAHDAAIYSSCGSVVTVAGGTYEQVNALQTGDLGGTLIVNGGVFTGDIKSYMGNRVVRGVEEWEQNLGKITITAGTFDGDFVEVVPGSDKMIWDVKGGSFTADPTAYLADGYKAVNNGDNTWTVRALLTYAITIGEIENATLTIDGDAAVNFNAVEDQEYTLAVTPAKGYENATITFNGATIAAGEYTFTEEGTLAASAEAIAYNITYTVVDEDGASVDEKDYSLDATAFPETYTVEDAITFDSSKVTIVNTEKYEAVKSIAPASIALGTTGEQPVMITLTKKAADEPKNPEEPFDPPPGKTAEQYAAELKANPAALKAIVKAPTCVTGDDIDTYKTCFTAVASGNKVMLVLDEEAAKTTIVPKLNTAEASIVGGNFSGTVTVEVIPGLYYGIAAKADVGEIKGADAETWVQATSENKASFTLTVPEVKVDNVKSDKAFFQVKCTDVTTK